MQINNIQAYNTQPQFKALRLRKGSERYLSSMPDRILNKLDSIGEYLADTKFYNLDISNDGFYITHSSGEKLYQPIIINNAGQVLLIKAKQGLSPVTKKLKFDKHIEVSNIEDKIKQAPTQLERTAEIVKVLDDYEKTFEKKETLVIDPKTPREEKINLLIKKFGI